jgi:hypothetical protein
MSTLHDLATAALGVAVGLGIGVGLGLLMSLSPYADERRVDDPAEDTVRAFLAAAGHDGKKACLQLSREAQDELKRREDTATCEHAADSTVPHPDTASQFDFGAIRFAPDEESARIPSASEVRSEQALSPIPLEGGDGHWRITELDWYFDLRSEGRWILGGRCRRTKLGSCRNNLRLSPGIHRFR